MSIILKNIKKIVENEGITITKLEQIIGASKGVLSRAMSNDSDIQVKWILKLVENFPNYNCEWLLKSEGSMIRDENADNFQSKSNDQEKELTYKKLSESQKETIESLQKVISLLEKEVADCKKRFHS